jgi:hypothetical protein
VEAPWRIIADGRIAFADTDDGQKFGLPEPVKGAHLANSLLAKLQVQAVTVDRVTADIRMDFETGTRIEVLNNSSGYEAWQAEFVSGDQLISLVGMGGGDIGFSISEGPTRPSVLKMSVLPRI